MNHSPRRAEGKLKAGFFNPVLQGRAESHNHLKHPRKDVSEEVRLVVGNPEPCQHSSCPPAFPFSCLHGNVPHVPAPVSLRTFVLGSLGTLRSHLDVSGSRKVSAKETKPDCIFLHITKLKSKFSYACISNVSENRYFHTLTSAALSLPTPTLYREEGSQRCDLADASAQA